MVCHLGELYQNRRDGALLGKKYFASVIMFKHD